MASLTQNNCSNICTTPVAIQKPAVITTLLLWHERYKSRKQLAQLEPYMLVDIGISYETAQLEAHIPFWRAS